MAGGKTARNAGPSGGLPREQPPSFRADLRREFGRLLEPPRADLWNLLTNGLMVTGGWLLLSPAVREVLFGLQGPLAFAVTLESWMLADTAGTNMLAEDAASARAAIRSGGAVQHLLRVKTVALACLIGPSAPRCAWRSRSTTVATHPGSRWRSCC